MRARIGRPSGSKSIRCFRLESILLDSPAAAFGKLIGTVADLCQKEVVGPLEQGKPTNPDRVTDWTTQNTPKDPNRAVFDDAPDKLAPRTVGR